MTVYKTPGGSWKVDFRRARVGEKPIRETRIFQTKTEALSFEQRLKGAVATAAAQGLARPSRVTLAEALAKWWEEAGDKFSPASRNSARLRAQTWGRGPLGQLYIADITRAHLKGWLNRRLTGGVSESTVRNDLLILKALFRHAESEWDWSLEDPAGRLLQTARLSMGQARSRRLSPPEYKKLCEAFEKMQLAQATEATGKRHERLEISLPSGEKINFPAHPCRLTISAAFHAAIECAMRRGKLFSLTWSEINLDRRVIEVNDTGPENKMVPVEIPISPTLTGILQDLSRATGAPDDQKVFGALTADKAYKILKETSNILGIKNLRWHDLRHEACSRLADLGWPVLHIQAVSGHKSVQSLKRYTHIQPETILRRWDEGQTARSEP